MQPEILTLPDAQTPQAPAQPRTPRKFRLIPRFETDPAIVNFAQTVRGKLVLLAIFGLTLSMLDAQWWIKLALVSCMAFAPKMRNLFLLIGAILLTDILSFEGGQLTRFLPSGTAPSRWNDLLWVVLPFVLLSAGLMWVATNYRESVIARRPLLSLLAICGVSISLACYAPLTGFPRYAVWAFAITFSGYLWFLAYALTDCASGRGQKIPYQFGAFRPFWALGVVPVPKGWGHWRRIEAKTPEDLAVTMIKGVKLIVWCLLLVFVNRCYGFIVYEKLRIPYPSDCLQAMLAGRPLPFAMNWASWPADLLAEILSIAIRTHAFIATCRMGGFRALRNTYAPLASRTIAEYWNRYYYYFKELLVDMFFYPTFIRCFKRRPRLRLFFATFVAAGFGNTLYHFLFHISTASRFGLLSYISSYRGYLFYSLLLALGISISQIRSRKSLGSRGWLRERVIAPACVVSFYCFVHVFVVASPWDGMRYLAYLCTGR